MAILVKPAKIAAGLCLAAFVLTLAACAPKVVKPVTGERLSKAELLAELDLAIREFDALKGFARIRYRDNDQRKKADHVVIARYPDSLRLETLGLFGSPAMMAVTDGQRSTVLFPGESRAFVGPAESRFLGRLTRMPITTEMIVAMLLRRPQVIDASEVGVEYPAEGISRLHLQNGREQQVVDFDGARNLVRVDYLVDAQRISTIKYTDYSSGFPQRIVLALESTGAEVEIEFDDVETNPALDDALFRLAPSDAYTVEPFPES